jgi:hypothetical protein
MTWPLAPKRPDALLDKINQRCTNPRQYHIHRDQFLSGCISSLEFFNLDRNTHVVLVPMNCWVRSLVVDLGRDAIASEHRADFGERRQKRSDLRVAIKTLVNVDQKKHNH